MPYLSQAGSLYDAFQRAKESTGTGPSQPRNMHASSKSEQISGFLGPGHHSRQASISSAQKPGDILAALGSPPERPQAKRKSSGGLTRRGPLPLAPLSTVPQVYFDPDFHLENPRIFDIVSERSEIVRSPPGANGAAVSPGTGGRKALATNAILQEKLSWYMDTVEVHLISSISTASSSFFAALGSLRDLHREASASVAKIQALRADLATLDNSMAAGGLKVVAMRRRRENVRKLGNAVEQLRDVVKGVARCEDQVDQGEIEEALLELASVEGLIAGEKVLPRGLKINEATSGQGNLVDLRGIKALDGASAEIVSLRQRIGKSFEVRFLEALLSDLRKHVDSVPSNTTFQRWDKASQKSRGTHTRTPSAFPAFLHVDETLRAILRSNLDGLAQSDSLKSATTAYREAVWKEVKTLIRRHLPSSSDDDNESTMSASTQGGRHLSQQERSSLLARNLRALEPEDAEDMLKKIYSNVGEALRRLGTQVKVVLDVTSSFKSAPVTKPARSPMSPPAADWNSYIGVTPTNTAILGTVQQEDIQQTLDMSNLLGQAVDIAQAQITKILKVRSEQSTRLPLSSFIRYFQLNRLFADECEAVSGRGGMALKTVVNAHIIEYVHHAADSERQHLVAGMDADRWDAKDFDESDTQLLSQIIEASTKEIEPWVRSSIIWDYEPPSVDGEQHTNGALTNGASQKDKTRPAIIDEQRYLLPDSALSVMNGIGQFEQLMTGIPNMTHELTSSLLDYLKLFNSRSSQLILGAGATRSAGLKNITTKHLALASQALSFVITLTPYVREFVRRHSPSAGSLMVEFDKVKRLYQEHQAGINEKLVDIMSGRATTHVNIMKKINWDATSSGQAISPYMETLVKETTTLHKVLSKHLPDMTVQMIMDPVFSSYREQWGKAFHDVDVKTVAGKERYAPTYHFPPHYFKFYPSIVIDKCLGCFVTPSSSSRAYPRSTARAISAITSLIW